MGRGETGEGGRRNEPTAVGPAPPAGRLRAERRVPYFRIPSKTDSPICRAACDIWSKKLRALSE